MLGIPALDGRKTHTAPLPASIETDDREPTARFGPPFDGVTLRIRVLDEKHVEYVYDHLPDDARLVMCQFNIPQAAIVSGLTVTFDRWPPVTIPVEAGKTNAAARLADANAPKLTIQWPSGDTLALAAPKSCWHGAQDARVWGKPFVGVCLTPSLPRDQAGGDTATFVMIFDITSASVGKSQ